MVAGVNPADHIGLVYLIANKYRHRDRSSPVEDLVQEGALGVMHAATKFDPSRGVKFSTYATHWIHAYIQRYLLDKCRTIRIPLHKHWALKRTNEIPPHPVSLDQKAVKRHTNGDDLTLHDVIANPNAERPDDAAERRELEAHLDAALSTLKPRLRYVLKRRFVDERTLEEIGGELGVVRERVRQLENLALNQLRKYFDEFVH